MSYTISERILVEQAIMKREMPQFKLQRTGNDWCFIGWQPESITNRNYQLKLVLPKYYPDQIPHLYVISPTVLKKYGGGTINEMENSHYFHTLNKGPQGCVTICHHKPSSWDASNTCLGTFVKGILWIQAYASHILTGRTVADILNDWQKKQ